MNRMSKTLQLLLAVALLAAVLPMVAAETMGDEVAALFARIDEDGDDILDTTELMVWLESKDLQLHREADAAERESLMGEVDVQLRLRDSDGDGRLSFDEVWAGVAEQLGQPDLKLTDEMPLQLGDVRANERMAFTASDADGDGYLDRDEILTMLHPELPSEEDRADVASRRLSMTKQLMGELDRNMDKLISWSEYWAQFQGIASAEKRQKEERNNFHRYDVDGDNLLDVTELVELVFKDEKDYLLKQVGLLMAPIDSNADGMLTYAEVASKPRHFLNYVRLRQPSTAEAVETPEEELAKAVRRAKREHNEL
eukprot:PLAT6561.1.p2 GENE.PLAT6561.1~~PLAT6561.1.p2  ORF type:complete len:312 (+),score=161.63 PLAT6561.1:2-937(+)